MLVIAVLNEDKKGVYALIASIMAGVPIIFMTRFIL